MTFDMCVLSEGNAADGDRGGGPVQRREAVLLGVRDGDHQGVPEPDVVGRRQPQFLARYG